MNLNTCDKTGHVQLLELCVNLHKCDKNGLVQHTRSALFEPEQMGQLWTCTTLRALCEPEQMWQVWICTTLGTNQQLSATIGTLSATVGNYR